MAKNTIFFNVASRTDERAVIDIDGVIGGWDWETWERVNTGKIIRKALRELKNTKEIEVRISSIGGDVDQALQIHDALRDHPAHITTIVTGFCASAATIIALAGDDRLISRNALYLIHKCSSSTSGNEHDLEMELESQKTVNEVMLDMYRQVNKKSEHDLLDLFNYDNGHGKWITAQEAVNFGFCTDMVSPGGASTAKAAMVDDSLLAKLQYPQIPEEIANENNTDMNIIDKAREMFAPKTAVEPIINQKQNEMKKLNVCFALLAALLFAEADKEYNDQEGLTLSDDQLGKLEKELSDYDDLKEQYNQMKAAKEQLESEKSALETSNQTLTAERDEYKAKWEAAPAHTTKVDGSDNTGDNFDVTDNATYEQLEKLI